MATPPLPPNPPEMGTISGSIWESFKLGFH